MHAHDHAGVWMAAQPWQVSATQAAGCQAQAEGQQCLEGHAAAQPHAWRGGEGGAPSLLGNSSKFRPSLGHARLRNLAAQPVPATGRDPVPAELSPRAKPVPSRGPHRSGVSGSSGSHPAPHVLSLQIPWVCASSPALFVSLTHRPEAIPVSCPPRPACRNPDSRTCLYPSRSWTDPAPWAVALGGHTQCKSQAGVGNTSSPRAFLGTPTAGWKPWSRWWMLNRG